MWPGLPGHVESSHFKRLATRFARSDEIQDLFPLLLALIACGELSQHLASSIGVTDPLERDVEFVLQVSLEFTLDRESGERRQIRSGVNGCRLVTRYLFGWGDIARV